MVYMLRIFAFVNKNVTASNQTKTLGRKSDHELQLVMMAGNHIQAPTLKEAENLNSKIMYVTSTVPSSEDRT